MTDSATPKDASRPDRVTRSAGRWRARFWEQLKRFRGPIAGATVIALAVIALAFVQLPTVWQTIVTVASVGAVLSGLVGYWTTYHAVKKTVPSSASAQAHAAENALSVVVLPFKNLTGDANQDYVADGLTASQTADLSRIRDAFVVTAATAFTYKDKPVTAQQVGKDLGVRFVLQGSVQRSGAKVRINAQLADANSNAQLWSESFEGDQSDLFALQDRVTTLVGNSIGREMVIVAARESEIRKTSPKVADLMLRAEALMLKPQSLEVLQQIQDLRRQALAQEPNNADAMAGLASALKLQAENFVHQMDEHDVEKKKIEAYALALRAKELDPEIPGIYPVLATHAEEHGDVAGSRRAYETYLRLAPKDPHAYGNLGVSYFYGAEPNRAIELLTQAINLDPKHPNDFNLLNMGRAYFMLGDNNAAIEWILKSMEIDSNHNYKHAYLAMAYALNGENAKAHAATADLRRLDPGINFLDHERAASSGSVAFGEWYEDKLMPAARKAGFAK